MIGSQSWNLEREFCARCWKHRHVGMESRQSHYLRMTAVNNNTIWTMGS